MSDAAEFEPHRRRCFAIAYRMLGSVADAEDVVQEAWLRFATAEAGSVDSPGAWLATVVTRLCLDQLKSARARREEYVGPWLPEPVATAAAVDERADPETLSMAFLLLLERLTPLERAAFLLHEVFDHRHAEVGAILGRDEVTCRQLVRRARLHIAAGGTRFPATRADHERLLLGFAQACGAGDVGALRELLAADVVALSDGGGKAHAARNPLRGADAVSRFFVGVARKPTTAAAYELLDLNGRPALVTRAADGTALVALLLEAARDDGGALRVGAVHAVVNPDKLRRLAAPAR